MGNKLIGIAFIFIGIVFLIFGIVTVYVGNMLSGLVALIPSDISGNFSFLGLLTTGSLVFGIIEIVTAVLSFIAGISLVRYKEE